MPFFKKPSSIDSIIIFLGNPGPRYAKTRHNAGFMAAEELAGDLSVKINKIKYKSLTAQVNIGDKSVLLMKPQTFMNNSGEAAAAAMNFYKTPLENVIVVSDDVTLPLGKLRVRRQGSAGGHNGLKSIIEQCGGEGFARIKIGVGEKPFPDMDLYEWVLSEFKGQELVEIGKAAIRAAQCVKELVTNGAESAMAKFN